MRTYEALLTQTSESAPACAVLDPMPNDSVAWTRLGAGIYRGTPSAPFCVGRTAVYVGHNNGGRYIFNAFIDWEEEVGTIVVQSLLQDPFSGALDYTDNALYNTAILVREY